jgi:hypothetical protein
MAEILGTLSEKATGKKSDLVKTLEQNLTVSEKNNKTSKEKKEPTVQKPFNITQPKPKSIPEPIKIPKGIKSKPVPEVIYKRTLNEIEQGKKQRLEEEKAKVRDLSFNATLIV